MAIEFKHVSYTYQAGTPFEQQALDDISVKIKDGSFTALVGHTGSGKSTFIQHLNGLLKPTAGEIQINDQLITPQTKNKELDDLRHQVGILFQFSENQLFEETVLKDIAFAPKNFGKSESEAEELARTKAKLVGIDDQLLERSPFELSGGQMRRVALAGILAMEPQILVLDEPLIGLDPVGKRETMRIFKQLHENEKMTILIVTHNMDDVADYADQVIALERGKLIAAQSKQEFFSDPQWLYQHHLGLPRAAEFAVQLMQKGTQWDGLPLNVDELARQLVTKLK
ncbi:energy-coupling factor transporter ATPase [Ligilactobacillus aviarius]|uniref:Energy-coupling factor transporter ATP-binding protein EcfA2 n=1 Tax=Ligilactobacillus aviarius TaxID=1606 RepID=A0A510WYI8_9LACO|nr:energy-coupling factor transporter ATPase [Ligilactobacillus aviarius]KRM39972.1 cobalt transport ATP-binding protein [Ligilactobacillus aviarius subsp. aviarius DSM 20655]GEK41480.1 energy-coupling factor transporter ATP-binding protein EcfA2 [Ligilactobacillus aviarius]